MDISAERAYPTPFANSALLPLLLVSLATQKPTPKATMEFVDEYDYIIVGGGSAGSVVASRLSELSCKTVLLLEAGKPAPWLTEVPVLSRHFINTDIDWMYKTVPQKHTARSLVNREIPWPSGKGIGGSSLFNAMIYSRGNRKNYDDWAAQGAEGWSFEDVWPYFLKLENNTDPEYLGNGYHSSDGPMSFHKPRYNAKVKGPLIEAVKKAGYRMVDPNGARQTGFYDFQANLRNSQRCNTAKAYLVPAENRRNLHIVLHANVEKIVMNKNKAEGVKFVLDGSNYTVKARSEVILTAGTVNTAQLLMLSGIGPKEHLESLGIPVVADLPVGNNFHDHPFVPMTYELPDTFETTTTQIEDPRNLNTYMWNRTGPLASAQFTSLVGFVNVESPNPEVDFPTAQIFFADLTTDLIQRQVGLKDEVYRRVFEPYENKPLYIGGAAVLQPKSRGTIRLQSNSPYDSPLIDPNYYDDPQDVEDTVKALKIIHELSTSEPLEKVGSKPLSTVIPGCEDVQDDQERYYKCMVRSIVNPMNHPVGTAKMGDPSDSTTVVDPKLRVKGIEGLRVMDASVMPIIPSANLNIPTIMVAEKGSDIIKETVHCQKYEDDNSIHRAIFEDY